jgi:hypothetical protein
MRHSAIQIRTEEPDYSDIPRTEYDWEFSVYRGNMDYWIQMDGNVSIVLRREPRRC